MAVMTDANIPVVYTTKNGSVTRHYQEALPMYKHKGMTNRLLSTLVDDMLTFLVNGTLPAEPA